MKPDLSVIVPVRGREDLLARCLASIGAQRLAGESLQILVCDDGSDPPLEPRWPQPCASNDGVSERRDTDASAGDGAGHEWQRLRQSAKGPAAARNLGLKHADADLVAFVDSDVELAPDCLAQLLAALRDHSDWAGAEAALLPRGGEDSPLWDAPSAPPGEGGGRYHTAAIAYRREAVRAAGGFDEGFTLPASEDVELAVRILRTGTIGFVPAAVAWHPRRKVTFATHWAWRRHWYYTMVLAVRYGILAFPGRAVGRFPRARVALAACLNLPAGRLLRAVRSVARKPAAGFKGTLLALFDFFVGAASLPAILLAAVPDRRDYVRTAAINGAIRDGSGEAPDARRTTRSE